MAENYHSFDFHTSKKLHFWDSLIDYFPRKPDYCWKVHGGRCHQDMKDMNKMILLEFEKGYRQKSLTTFTP